jgi:hypothetical protein
MAARILKGDTYISVAQWLDDEGIAPPSAKRAGEVRNLRGGRTRTVSTGVWSQTSVRNVLTSPALKGRYCDASGKVVHQHEGIMDAEAWAELQQAIGSRPSKRGPSNRPKALLTGLIVCHNCGGPMYRIASGTKRADGTVNYCEYYRCKGSDRAPSSCRNSVPVGDIEGWVSDYFEPDGRLAIIPVVECRVVAGDDHGAEIADVKADLAAVDYDAADALDRVAALHAELKKLQARPVAPHRVDLVETGETVGQVWARLDEQGRRRYLLATGLKVEVMSNDDLRQAGKEFRRLAIPADRNVGEIVGRLADILGEVATAAE